MFDFDHDQFRELSALAMVGQLSSEENRRLNDHLSECADCRKVHEDYSHIIQHKLPQADVIRWRTRALVPRSSPDTELLDRFLARARAEGIDFSPEARRPQDLDSRFDFFTRRRRSALIWTTVAALALVGVGNFRRYEIVHRSQVLNVRPTQPSETELLNVRLETLRQVNQTQSNELERLKHDNLLVDDSVKYLQIRLIEMRNQVNELSVDLERSKSENAELSSSAQQKDRAIASLHVQNGDLSREQADNVSDSVIQESRIRELTTSLERATENLERERQLAAVTNDVRQLMGARNLHIIDVHDVDGDSKSAKAFGRVFYAEAESLVFYAFDLPNGALSPAKYTFQAWGQREASPSSPRNLGVFEVDDHVQRRWVLKVNDHGLLTGIDSVFVTAESIGDSKLPRGKKLLYAYIAGTPNHP
jgi:polyhydroxyalkanoate synthesis regulator phasin